MWCRCALKCNRKLYRSSKAEPGHAAAPASRCALMAPFLGCCAVPADASPAGMRRHRGALCVLHAPHTCPLREAVALAGTQGAAPTGWRQPSIRYMRQRSAAAPRAHSGRPVTHATAPGGPRLRRQRSRVAAVQGRAVCPPPGAAARAGRPEPPGVHAARRSMERLVLCPAPHSSMGALRPRCPAIAARVPRACRTEQQRYA